MEAFRIKVDYSHSLEEMIATGRYDWKDDGINANRFPIEGEGVVEFEARYFNFDHKISSEDAVKEIEQADKGNPWMPAKIEHVLSHGLHSQKNSASSRSSVWARSRRSMAIAACCAPAGTVSRETSTSVFGSTTGVRTVFSSPFAKLMTINRRSK